MTALPKRKMYMYCVGLQETRRQRRMCFHNASLHFPESEHKSKPWRFMGSVGWYPAGETRRQRQPLREALGGAAGNGCAAVPTHHLQHGTGDATPTKLQSHLHHCTAHHVAVSSELRVKR